MDLTEEETAQLIESIATREGTAKQIAKWYGVTVDELRMFVAANQDALLEYRDTGPERQPQRSTEPDPMELSDLWLTNKFERLKRLQRVADACLEEIESGAVDQALMREFRSYLALAANELGQLLHRGSGEGTENTLLEVDMVGIDMENLR
jgi:hypothetical protein